MNIKICVFSDSHGGPEYMITAIGREEPRLCFFLGDGVRDLVAVESFFPDLPVYAVRGNCDLHSALSPALVCTVGGVGIFATHGHLYNVKHETVPRTLTRAAKEAGAQAALFGHTHCPYCEERDGILLLNPGAIGRTTRPSYAVLEIENGRCRAELKTL